MSSPTTLRSGRRRFLVGAVALALAGSLAACGSDSGDAEDGSAGQKASGAFPAQVATKFGTVTVKERPERVVALGWGDAETALALGVQPVA
ncbi:iron-siderophore ABC transporter substrate-binding protein, partial [Streptomyces albidoflavus]